MVFLGCVLWLVDVRVLFRLLVYLCCVDWLGCGLVYLCCLLCWFSGDCECIVLLSFTLCLVLLASVVFCYLLCFLFELV